MPHKSLLQPNQTVWPRLHLLQDSQTNQNNLTEIKQLLFTQEPSHTTVPKDIRNYAAQETHDSVAKIVKNLGGGPSATNKAMLDQL